MLWPNRTQSIVLCGFFAALIAAGAFIKIPVPFIPFTLQFLFTNLAELMLGKKYGAAAIGLYILLGLLGLPVFAGGGGFSYIFQPTFGYLAGFLIGGYMAGRLTEKYGRGTRALLLAGAVNLGIVYLTGLIYYYFIMLLYVKNPVSAGVLFVTGFLMAVPGDIALCLLSVFLVRRLAPVFRFR